MRSSISVAEKTVRATCLEVTSAKLSARGCMQEHSPDGRQPTVYDYDRLDSFPNDAAAAKERKISDARRALHKRIDSLKAELELWGR